MDGMLREQAVDEAKLQAFAGKVVGDIAAYLALFNAQDDAADLNDDGLLNFFDLSTYLNLFNAGCP